MVGDEDVSGLLDVVETFGFADSSDLGNDSLLEVGVLGDRGRVGGFTILLGPGLSTFVEGDNHDGVALKGVGVDETGANQVTDSKGTFELLRSNVLTLRKFHDHLGTINDGNTSVLVGFADISGVEPALLIEGFLGDLREQVVALEDVRASDLDLSAGVRLVGREVVHFRNVLQSNLGASNRSSNVTEVRIFFLGCGGSSRGLTESITFKKGTSEHNLHEGLDSLIKRSRSSNHALNLTTQDSFDLLENEEVIASVSVSTVVVVVLKLSGESLVNEPGFATTLSFHGIKSSRDFSVDLVVKTRYRCEMGRLE